MIEVKTIPKLEALFGAVYFFLLILHLYVIDFPITQVIAEREGDLGWTLWSFWGSERTLITASLGLVIALSAFFHAVKRSLIALAVLLIMGFLLLIIGIMIFLAGGAGNWVDFSLLLSLILTMTMAIVSTFAVSGSAKIASQSFE